MQNSSAATHFMFDNLIRESSYNNIWFCQVLMVGSSSLKYDHH